jgi:hypothetical protein
VVRELLLQRGIVRFLLHRLEHLQHRLLHRQRGAELVREELGRTRDLWHPDPFRGYR